MSSTCTQHMSALWESACLCKILLYAFGHFFSDSTKEMGKAVCFVTGCLFYTLIVSVEWLVKQKKYPSQYGQVLSWKWLKSSQRLMRSAVMFRGRARSDAALRWLLTRAAERGTRKDWLFCTDGLSALCSYSWTLSDYLRLFTAVEDAASKQQPSGCLTVTLPALQTYESCHL